MIFEKSTGWTGRAISLGYRRSSRGMGIPMLRRDKHTPVINYGF
jgi:hypothetical protein